MKFKDYLTEAAGDTVGVMFGRFNPPHRGHKAAWEMASENDHWYVGTNQSTQGKKDPLPYDIKIAAMEALWPEVGSHIVPETNLFTLATKVFAQHGKVNLTVYTDEDWLTKTLEKYNGEEGKHGYYDFESITQKPTPRLSSATDVRNAVLADDRDAFERAAGVPADFKIQGKDFFDVVAEYLLPHHPKPAQEDKYNKEDSLEESTMDMQTLRQLAGLEPEVQEGAPVEFKPQHDLDDTAKKLAGIGRLMMDMAMGQQDDAVSNAMAQLGDRLATGEISSQEDLVGFIKKSRAEPAALSNAVTATVAAYNKGERADPVDDRVKGRKTEYVPPVEDEDEVEEEGLDLSNIRDDYGVQEGEGGTCSCCGNEITAEGCGCGPDCEHCGGMGKTEAVEEGEMPKGLKDYLDKKNGKKADEDEDDSEEEVEEAIEETTDNAYAAAMAELRALAGL